MPFGNPTHERALSIVDECVLHFARLEGIGSVLVSHQSIDARQVNDAAGLALWLRFAPLHKVVYQTN